MTSLIIRANLVDADIPYSGSGGISAHYITLDLVGDSLGCDYLIWSEDLENHLTHEPDSNELNEHAVILTDTEHLVPELLVMDYSHDWGGDAYYTHLIKGMGENAQYVLCFSFSGATATEPQLEAWDDADHDTFDKDVLGLGVEGDSWVRAMCTTTACSSGWEGIAIAGDSPTRVVKLNDESGALDELESGETSQELYANIKIVVPADYPTPFVASFYLTVRYSWN